MFLDNKGKVSPDGTFFATANDIFHGHGFPPFLLLPVWPTALSFSQPTNPHNGVPHWCHTSPPLQVVILDKRGKVLPNGTVVQSTEGPYNVSVVLKVRIQGLEGRLRHKVVLQSERDKGAKDPHPCERVG